MLNFVGYSKKFYPLRFASYGVKYHFAAGEIFELPQSSIKLILIYLMSSGQCERIPRAKINKFSVFLTKKEATIISPNLIESRCKFLILSLFCRTLVSMEHVFYIKCEAESNAVLEKILSLNISELHIKM